MKTLKFLIVMMLASITSLYGYAANPTEEDVDNYKASIMSYMKAEGYLPKLDSDGDVAFKHDGDSYWVQASPYDDGYYVTVLTITPIEGYNINKIREIIDETARGLKYVRLYTSSTGKSVYLSYSWYCVSITDFKRMFGNALDVVSTADSRLIKGILALD